MLVSFLIIISFILRPYYYHCVYQSMCMCSSSCVLQVSIFTANHMASLVIDRLHDGVCGRTCVCQGREQVHTFVFRLTNDSACRHLWKSAVDHHVFFRLTHNTHPVSSQSPGRWSSSSVFRRSRRSIQRDELRVSAASFVRRQDVAVNRRPSQRFPPRRSTFTSVTASRSITRRSDDVTARTPQRFTARYVHANTVICTSTCERLVNNLTYFNCRVDCMITNVHG